MELKGRRTTGDVGGGRKEEERGEGVRVLEEICKASSGTWVTRAALREGKGASCQETGGRQEWGAGFRGADAKVPTSRVETISQC